MPMKGGGEEPPPRYDSATAAVSEKSWSRKGWEVSFCSFSSDRTCSCSPYSPPTALPRGRTLH